MFKALVLSAAALLAGCALNSEVRISEEPDAALIFGFFDMKDSPYELGWWDPLESTCRHASLSIL